jgi:predicted nuclease with TOPRIM domain
MASLTDPTNIIVGAITAAISGGLFTKWIDSRAQLKMKIQDGREKLTEEYRIKVTSLETKVALLETRLEEWQKKYWELHASHTDEVSTLRAEQKLLQARFDELNRAATPLRRMAGEGPVADV